MRRRGPGLRASWQHPSMWKGAYRPGVCKIHRRSGEPSLSLSLSLSLAGCRGLAWSRAGGILGHLCRHTVLDRSIPVPDLLELILSPSPRCEADDLGLAMAPVKNRVQGGARTLLYQRRGSLCNVGCKGEPSLFLTRAGFAFSTTCICDHY